MFEILRKSFEYRRRDHGLPAAQAEVSSQARGRPEI